MSVSAVLQAHARPEVGTEGGYILCIQDFWALFSLSAESSHDMVEVQQIFKNFLS